MDNLFDKITFESRSGDPSTYKVWDSGAARIISEFTMAERRQNLMSGDGYNTIYAKLSRWYEDFKPIVWSGSYNDLENKPVIPVVNDGILEIKRNGVSVQTFSANSNMNVVANIEVPIIDDNNSSATTLYSSQRIDALIRELGPNIIDGGGQEITIDSETIDQIAQQVINSITIPTAVVDYNTIYQYIDEHMPEVNNGKLSVKINGVAALSQNGNILPALSNYFGANQSEDYDLNIIIPELTEIIDNSNIANNTTWSSEKIRNEILASGSLRMVVLGDGVSHLSIQGESNTIYFEKITNSDLENQYSEWVWTGDAWENIGRQVIDLSAYALKSEIGNATIRIVQVINNTPTELGSFTTNEQSNGTPHDITIPTPIIGNGTITIVMGRDIVGGVEQDRVIGTFSVNQIGNTTITIPEPEQIQSDWDEANNTSPAFILNKPAIPVVNNGTLTITVGGVAYTFTANQSTNQNIEIPAQVNSDWNSNSGVSEILNKPTLGTAASKDVAASGNASANQVVMGNDTRLTDARTPVFHQHTVSEITDFPTIPNAQVNSDWNSSSGVSQILNKPNLATVATSGNYNDLSNKPTIPDSLSDLSDDSTHRLVTDTEKTTWNNKSNFSGSYNDLTDKPTIPDVTNMAKIRFITASSIQNNLNNIVTTNYQVNDIVCIINPSSTLVYGTGNNAVTLYNIPFEPMFRWTGTEFKPMFYYIN